MRKLIATLDINGSHDLLKDDFKSGLMIEASNLRKEKKINYVREETPIYN
jgi:hypothetical protein